MTLFIDWQPNVVALDLGFLQVRWYSLLWAIGLLAAYLIVMRLYKQMKIEDEKFEPLFFYCFIGVLLGARLGHCIFYEPGQYLTSIEGWIEMFLPIRNTVRGWQFTGYEGLASHGGTIGLFLALLLYCKRMKMKVWTVIDMVGIAAPFTSCCIRLGNLMNSEIIGITTDVPWAFIFYDCDARGNLVSLGARHPAQLYEAIAYLIIGIVGVVIYRKWLKTIDAAPTAPAGMFRADKAKKAAKQEDTSPTRLGSGFYFGFCLAAIFTFRFFVEFLKKEQVDFEQGMLLDMGQLLSVPIVIVGAWCMVRAYKNSK